MSVYPTQLQPQGIIRNQIVTRLRFENPSEFVNGRAVTNPPVRTEHIHVSLQPPNRKGSDRIRHLSEGQRIEDWVVVYSDVDTFHTALEKENVKADRLIYRGNVYEVQFKNLWAGGQLTHDEVFALRLDESADQ